MLCVLIFYAIGLYGTNQTWKEAARLSRSITDELARAASTERSLLVINAPDNLRGVPVFHNGLEEALGSFQKPGRREGARVLALQDLRSRGDEVELKREGDKFSLRLLDGADEFASIQDRLDCVEVLERSAHALQFRLNNCSDDPGLFIFNAGRMYRVIDGER